MAAPYAASYYAATANPVAPFERLEGDLDVDVAIVGGGFTGIASAFELSERGIRVAVLEQNRIGWGATSRNGGQITGSLSGDTAMLRQFRRALGPGVDEFVWNLRWRGHAIIRERVERYGISCDLTPGHMLAAWKPSHVAELREQLESCRAHGMGDEVELVEGAALREVVATDLYAAGLINRRNMHVHSLNLCLGEADAARGLGARIFEDTEVTEVRKGTRVSLVTPRGVVRADKVLLAGNAYHRLGGARLQNMLFPASLGVVATAPVPEALRQRLNPQNLAVYDTRFVLDYYRFTADGRLLFGGGTNYSGRASADIAAELRPAIERTFPDLAGIGIDFAWQGQAGITVNRIPQLGRLAPNIFYAQGYSGHGVATSHIVGEIMAQAMTGDPREFEIFEGAFHFRNPLGRKAGNVMLALGMWYFQKKALLLGQ